ncbi:MAG TPA: pitrilysin family protein [Stellaceae bacterium]|nr:pitrilysin family protein [Stellaceae bacterium]
MSAARIAPPAPRLLLGLVLCLGLAVSPAARAFTIERVRSPGGIEAWLVEDHSLPIVTLEFSFRGGAATEPKEKLGLARMTTALLDEGAGRLDSGAYQARLEDLASSVAFGASQDYVTGSLRTVTKNVDAAFDLLRLALTEPRFDAEPLARIRADLIAEVAQRAENPNAVANRVWWRNAFDGHPYARPTDGTAATLAAITVADLKRFAHDRFARDALTIGVVGDVAPEALASLLDKTFGPLPAEAAPAPVAPATAQDAGALLLVKKPIPQSVATFGEPGIKRDDPDWYAAYLDNYILGGGGFSSRLMEEVRVKRGLAYGVYTYLVPLRESGVILGGVATRNDAVAQSIDIIREEWRRMHDDGPTAEELANAKTYLTGSFPLQFDSTGRIAGTLVQMQEDKLGIDFLDKRNALIDAVTLEDAKRVAKRLFDPAQLGFAVVGTPTNLKPTREVTASGS